MRIWIDAFGITDIGRQRSENQDQFLVGKLEEGMSIQIASISTDRVLRLPSLQGTFLIVADGIGGHVGGRVASGVAVECFTRYLRWQASEFLLPREELPKRLVAAVRFCHRTLHQMHEQRPKLRGMGTTFTAAYVLGRKLYVVHVGDSRCYLLRQGILDQLTSDHTLAQLCLDSDAANVSPAAREKMSHVLWNCVGGSDDLEVEVIERDLRLGDLLVLCSDGLSKYVDKRSILAIAAESNSVATACRTLVAAANEAGGSDNITVVVGQCVGEQSHSPREANTKSSVDTEQYPSLADTVDQLFGCETPAACS